MFQIKIYYFLSEKFERSRIDLEQNVRISMNKSSQSISTSGQSLNVHQSHSKQQMQIEQWLQAHGIETALDKITEIIYQNQR